MPTTSCCDDLSACVSPQLFKALGEPQRVAILASLAAADEPQTVSQIGLCCPVDLSVVSRHLNLLRQAGVVDAEKRGRQVYYRIRYSQVVAALRELADTLEACCVRCQTDEVTS